MSAKGIGSSSSWRSMGVALRNILAYHERREHCDVDGGVAMDGVINVVEEQELDGHALAALGFKLVEVDKARRISSCEGGVGRLGFGGSWRGV